jgi:hypothetical protein
MISDEKLTVCNDLSRQSVTGPPVPLIGVACTARLEGAVLALGSKRIVI